MPRLNELHKLDRQHFHHRRLFMIMTCSNYTLLCVPEIFLSTEGQNSGTRSCPLPSLQFDTWLNEVGYKDQVSTKPSLLLSTCDGHPYESAIYRNPIFGPWMWP
jgi:hypothetical protein